MFPGNLNNAIPSLWNPHHSTDRREFSLGEIACSYAIRSDHEILDDLFGPVFFFSIELADLITVEYRFGLNGLQTKCACNMTKFFHALGSLILRSEEHTSELQ